MSLSNNYPTIRPTLEFDFANVGALDPRITFTRATSATFVNQLGVIQTAASGIPRFDYDPSTLAARGLLIEEQRTNLLTYSEDFTNAAWSAIDGLSSTITANAAVAPDGTTTAEKIVETAVTGYMLLRQTASLVTGTNYTISFFAKAAERSFARILFDTGGFGVSSWYATFNLTNGTVSTNTSATITAFGNGWYRCSATAPTIGTGTYPIYLGPAPNATIGYTTYGGVAGSGIFIWGAQVEAGAFVTSYIPTVASTVTRNADAGTLVSLSPWYNSTEGSFYLETNSVRFTNPTYFFVQVNLTNSTAFSFNGTSWGVLNENVLVTDPNSGVAANQNSIDKIAYSYGSGSVAISVRGSTPVSASRSIATFTSLSLGNQSGAAHLRRMAFYPKKLSDAQLQALTS